VWIRGSDQSANWAKLYTYNDDILTIGKVQNSGTLSLKDALNKTGQFLSQSTQIKFSQNDTSVISLRNYGNGVTIDDVKLYLVFNDVELVSVDKPGHVECGLMGEVPLTVKIRNGVFKTLTNVNVSYQVDGGAVVTETIKTINGKTTIAYTFDKKMSFTKYGPHTVNIWLAADGDSYKKNDSLLNYIIHNQPLIVSFPYVENFESNNGYWYTEGLATSWEYGTPAGKIINRANSGSKAWVTDLDGNYNSLEFSYLYSPCFDVSSLKQPVFKFANAMDIENCGNVLCDAAYVEYSTNDTVWTKLGLAGDGFNWYNDTTFDVWTLEERYWQNSVITTPQRMSSVRFRFVFMSDPAVNREGFAVDDVEIFDYYPGYRLVGVYPNPVKDAFTIKWTANAGTRMDIVLTDITGRVVYRESVDAVTATYNETKITPPKLSSGIYILKGVIGNEYTFEDKLLFP
jgi:hypothetical protein